MSYDDTSVVGVLCSMWVLLGSYWGECPFILLSPSKCFKFFLRLSPCVEHMSLTRTQNL